MSMEQIAIATLVTSLLAVALFQYRFGPRDRDDD